MRPLPTTLRSVGVILATLAGLGLALADEERPRQGRRRAHRSVTEAVDCAACHDPSGWGMSGGTRGGAGFDHARTGFGLSGRHAFTSCTSCHVPGRTTRRECSSCHADTHQGRLGDSCDACHGPSSWNATTAQERHRLTRLPLDGAHALVDCAACHRRAAERTYSGTPAQCFACHEDDYRRGDVHPPHDGGGSGTPLSRDCTECHRTLAWSPAFFSPHPTSADAGAVRLASLRHDARFPIGFGPHRGAPCDSCHAGQPSSRTFECVGCHAHSPARLAAQHPGRRVPSEGRACLRCHAGGMPR